MTRPDPDDPRPILGYAILIAVINFCMLATGLIAAVAYLTSRGCIC